jgi:hypothetical protein
VRYEARALEVEIRDDGSRASQPGGVAHGLIGMRERASLFGGMISLVTDWTDSLQVFCADVGSIAKNKFAWARRLPGEAAEEVHVPTSIESLATAVVREIELERPVALGFEAPLFVPVPPAATQLGKARPCDLNAPAWSSSIGGSVMATGIAQVAWVLRRVHDCAPEADLYLRWEPFASVQEGLFLWEAFVTRGAKGATDEEDATIGLHAFCAQLPAPGDANADETERPLSLVAAAAMWAGWDLPPEVLGAACVLVRA